MAWSLWTSHLWSTSHTYALWSHTISMLWCRERGLVHMDVAPSNVMLTAPFESALELDAGELMRWQVGLKCAGR